MRYCPTQRGWDLEVEGVKMMLGLWWLQDAVRGGPVSLPVVNCMQHCICMVDVQNTGQGEDRKEMLGRGEGRMKKQISFVVKK